MDRIQISIGEGASWLMRKLQSAGLSLIPDQDQLDILTRRMEGEENQARIDYHAAIKAEWMVDNPQVDDGTDMGSLPSLKRRLARRNQQGSEYGAEYANANAARKAAIDVELERIAADIPLIESKIKGEEALLATLRKTTALCKQRYDSARNELAQLKQVAPAILAQTQALNKAKQDNLRAAAAAAKGGSSQAGLLIKQMQKDLEEATAGSDAAEFIAVEAAPQEDIDAVFEKRGAETSHNALIDMWKKTAPATAGASA